MSNIIITCDTESLLFPQNKFQTRDNIYGVSARDGRRSGIEKIIDLVDGVGGKVIFFYDVFTEYSCPGINQEIIDYILNRGHLVELHVHVEHLTDSWWFDRGYQKPSWAANYFDEKTVELVYSDALKLYRSAVGTSPKAYRAGAWRYNSNILKYLYSQGVKYSFNYHPLSAIRKSYPHGPDAGLLDCFEWSIGMFEVPTATILGPNNFSTSSKYFAFENHNLKNTDNYFYFLERFARDMPFQKNIVLVMHSWSLSNFESGIITGENVAISDAFESFLKSCQDFGYRISDQNVFDDLIKSKTSSMIVPIQFAGFGNSKLFSLNTNVIS